MRQPDRKMAIPPGPVGRLRTRARSGLLLLVLLLAVPLAPGNALAQSMAAPPAAGSGEQAGIQALIETLEDDAKRQKLLDRLKALEATDAKAAQGDAAGPAAAAPESGIFEGAARAAAARIEAAAVSLADTARLFIELPDRLGRLWESAQNPDVQGRLWLALGYLVLILAAGFAAEELARWALRHPRRTVEAWPVPGLGSRALVLALRTVLDVIPIGLFWAGAQAALALVALEAEARLVALVFINASLIERAVSAAARAFYAPRTARLRFVGLTDQSAVYQYVWVKRLVRISVYGYAAIMAAGAAGLAVPAQTALTDFLGLIIAALLIVVVFQSRGQVADWLRKEQAETGGLPASVHAVASRLSDFWHIAAIFYILAVLAVWLANTEGGFAYVARATLLSVFVLLLARLIRLAVRTALNRALAFSNDLKSRFPTLEERTNRFLPVFQGAVRTVINLIALIAILEVWGLSTIDWLASAGGQNFIGQTLTVLLVLTLAIVAWNAFCIELERRLRSLSEAAENGRRAARLQTLLPMIRRVAFIVLVIVVALMLLDQFGVNITPLIAGAGVAGLAVSFGAQKLVQDVITGGFILAEDTISIGDVVELGNHSGIVESMSVRSIRLRDLSGNVHTIPFSTVDSVMNMTKDYSRYLFNIGVAYREDYDQVAGVLHEISDEMQKDETYGPLIKEPLEILGLDSFGDNAVIIKARITTEPIQQWAVGREFNRRMKARFDELGIEIPFPHRTIYFGVDQQGNAPPAHIQLDDGPAGDGDGEPEAGADGNGNRNGNPNGNGDGNGDGGPGHPSARRASNRPGFGPGPEGDGY